jgi:hypothetical protein
MSPQEAVARLNTLLAHAWMVRTFLKHADEIQHSEDMLDVPRTLYDSIRAAEPAHLRGDLADFLRRLKGKLPKLRRAADYFAAHFKEFSPRAHVAAPGTLDLCFIAAVPLEQVVNRLNEMRVPVLEGPVMKTGASGPIRSVYVRDPDLNLIEISVSV